MKERKLTQIQSRISRLALALILLALGLGTASLGAQNKKGKAQPSAGARFAYFATAGEISESLPNGVGFQAYYEHPLSQLFPGLPAFAPQSVQAVLNYESLSNSETDPDTELSTSNSLSRVGIEAGPFWSFLLAESQFLSVGYLLGFANESAKSEIEGQEPQEPMEASGVIFSSHLLVNYEYHLSSYVLGGGLYVVYGADEELPLIGTGLNFSFGYKF